MEYVLYVILVIGNNSVSVDSEVYASEQACNAARAEVIQESRAMQVGIRSRIFCLPRGAKPPTADQ